MGLGRTDVGQTAEAALHEPGAARRYLWSIHTMRAFCAYFVISGHLVSAMLRTRVTVGVDIFFVISGFLVWTLASERNVAPHHFLFNRFTRIAPLYWVATLVVTALALWKPWTCWGCYPTPTRIIASLLFIPQVTPLGGPWPVLIQGWTLIYDMYFYVLFALSLAVPRRHRLAALMGIFIGLPLLGAALHPSGIVLTSYTSPTMLGFLGGILIGEAFLRGRLPGPLLAAVLTVGGLIAFIGLIVVHQGYSGWNILGWVAAALSIFLGTIALEQAGFVARPPFSHQLGNWSYATYLFHGVAISVVFAAVKAPFGVQVLLVFLVATLLGKLGYEGVERPINRLAQNFERATTPRLQARSTRSAVAG